MRGFALLVAALILAGCASAPKPTGPTSAASGPSAATAPSSASIGGPTLLANGPSSSLAPLYALACKNATAAWPDACDMRASIGPGPKEEVSLAVNPKDPKNVVLAAKDLNPDISDHCVWNGIYVTKDAGATWTETHIGGKFADRKPGDATYGYACNTDPDLAFAADGTLYFLVEMYEIDHSQSAPDPLGFGLAYGNELLLARSDDGGLTWPQTTVAQVGDGVVAFNDYSRMTVSPKTGTVAYLIGTYDTPLTLTQGTPAPASGIFATVVTSHDGGKTIDAPIVVTRKDAPGTLNAGAIAASGDGTFAVMLVGADGAWISISTDDAKTFSDPTPAFPMHFVEGVPNVKFRAGSGMEIAFDKKSGALYATWSDAVNGNADIFLAKSPDRGATWTKPVRVNDDTTKNAQWMSRVAVTDDGVVHVLFMDRRYDPADRLIDLTYASSADGGATWTNQRVTTKSFDGDLGKHQSGAPFIGDYLGLDAAGRDVWGGFPTTATGVAIIAAMHAARAA
ncbi:MAG: sialidase family protein [Thermoplasmatota archaeon]